MPERNKPVHTVRLGKTSASIWRNERSKDKGGGNYYNISLNKNYYDEKETDENKKWKQTNSYNLNEIPDAMFCLQLAYLWIREQMSKDNKKEVTM